MERKKTPTNLTQQLQTEEISNNIKVVVLPASGNAVPVDQKQEEVEHSRKTQIKHRPRKGFSYDGPGGSYAGF